MVERRFTKGDIVAKAFVNPLDDGLFRGLVLISRGELQENPRVFRAEPALESESEALEQAGALAEHLLKQLVN